jgi:hypothetical protein
LKGDKTMIHEYNVKKYCCEDISKIENYEKAMNDATQVWDCHHKMELIETGAVVDCSRQDLVDWGIYYNRPADELIFLAHGEHQILHKKGKLHHSEEIKKKISEAHKGKSTTWKGRYHSEESKRKMSEAWDYSKHFTAETRKKMSEAHKGHTGWFKGKHHSEEAKKKLSTVRKGKHWKLVDGHRVWY